MRLGRFTKSLFLIGLFSALLLCLFNRNVAWADQKAYPGLADGLDILSTYSGLHPKAEEAFDTVVKRAPEDMRDRTGASDWAERQAGMTPEELESAAADPDTTLLPTADGLAAVPNDKLRNGINALTDFAIDQEETADFVKSIRDRVPPEYTSAVDKIASQLDDLRKDQDGGLMQAGKRIFIKGTVSALAGAKLGELSEKIRDEVFEKGADRVLDDCREKAAENKRKIAQRIAQAARERAGSDTAASNTDAGRQQQDPAASASPQDAGDGDAQDAGAAKDTAGGVAGDEIERIKKDAHAALGEGEKIQAKAAETIAACRKAIRDAPSMPVAFEAMGSVPGGLPALKAVKESKDNLADALRRADFRAGRRPLGSHVERAERAAGTACREPDASSGADEAKKLDTIMDRVQISHDLAKPGAEEVISALNRPPIDRSALQRISQTLKANREYCRNNRGRADELSKRMKLSDAEKKAGEALWAYDSILRDWGRVDDLEIVSIRREFARLRSEAERLNRQAKQCLKKLRDAERHCPQNLKELDDAIDGIDKQIAEIGEMEAKRQDAREKVEDYLDRLNEDYSKVKKAVARGRDCLGEPGDQQTACDQEKIQDAFKRANAEYHKGGVANLEAARSILQGISAKYADCPGVADRVSKGKGLIDTLVSATTKIDDAIGNCDVTRMKSHIAQINKTISEGRDHPKMGEWASRIRKAIEDCRKDKVTSADPAGGAGSGSGSGSGGAPGGAGAGGNTAGTDNGGAGGGPGTGAGCTTQQQFRYGGGMGNGMSGGMPGGKSGTGPDARPECGEPCPPAPGWQLPAGTRCVGMADPVKPVTGVATGPKGPMGGKPGGSGVSAPPDSGRGGSGCGPPPSCPTQSCKPVGWRCVNNQWLGGHCECPKDAF